MFGVRVGGGFAFVLGFAGRVDLVGAV